MDQDDFEDIMEYLPNEIELFNLEQLKQVQRLMTKAIDKAQGFDGGKHMKKESMYTTTYDKPNYPSVEFMREFVASYTVTCPSVAVNKKEEEMNTETQDQRSYLGRQLISVAYTKDVELMKSFGLTDDPYPRKGSELLDRIKSGKYVLRDEKSVKWAESALDYIEWRDPAIVKDQDGFDAAHKVLQKSRLDTERTIRIADPADGLVALKAFEAMSFDKTTAPTTPVVQ